MKALAIFALLLVPLSVHAQREAKQLAADCAVDTTGMIADGKALESNPATTEIMKSPEKLIKISACLDYIRGVIDTLLVLSDMNEKGGWELTANYSPVELKDAFMAHLKEHPQTLLFRRVLSSI